MGLQAVPICNPALLPAAEAACWHGRLVWGSPGCICWLARHCLARHCTLQSCGWHDAAYLLVELRPEVLGVLPSNLLCCSCAKLRWLSEGSNMTSSAEEDEITHLLSLWSLSCQ